MTTPRTNYIFVDFENVHEIDLQLIAGKQMQVVLVIGERQKSLPMALVKQVHQFHAQVQFVEVGCSGKNALDLVLAYHIGLQAASNPDGYFHILSKDKGFDALVKHLRSQGVAVTRDEVFTAISGLKDVLTLSLKERVDLVKDRLVKMKVDDKDGRPKKEKTLYSMIHALFRKQLPNDEVTAVIRGLKKNQWIEISDDKVIYKL